MSAKEEVDGQSIGQWKRGRKLGSLAPLIGNWKATASTQMGRLHSREPILAGNYRGDRALGVQKGHL
jgi:hypothetical protein